MNLSGFGFERIWGRVYLRGGVENGACAMLSIRQAYAVLHEWLSWVQKGLQDEIRGHCPSTGWT